jgi:thiol-disulfide isomerase/thioredoxin
MRSLRIAVIGMLCLTFGQAERARADSPKPNEEIRKLSDFYKQLKSFSVACEMSIEIHAGEINNTMKGSTKIAFERPNRVALRGDGAGPMGATVVSDGKTLYTMVPALKRYTKRDAPKSLEKLSEDPILSGQGTGNFAVVLLGDDPAKLILKDVTASADLGTDKVDGRPARHLQFTEGDIVWQAWIAEGKEPVILQIQLDLSKMVKKNAGAAFADKEVKVIAVQKFKDWKLNVKLTPGDFTFKAPENVKEVENLLGRGGNEEEEEEAPSPLLGKAAPPVDVERLDGKRVKLADHAGKDVVMLDMWATWCGPCRAELPLLAEVAKEYKSKGVAFYAIDLRETKKKIDEFLKKQKYELTVGLDPEGKVAEAYGAEGIPLLAIIDKQGVVQSVHVGYSPQIKEVLHKELDALLAGKDLAAQTLAEYRARKEKAAAAKKQVAVLNGLKQVWTSEGQYSSAAYDPQSQLIFAVTNRGQCDVFSPDGKRQRSFKLKAEGGLLRLARSSRTGSPNLLVFGVWSDPVSACSSSDGSLLWTYKNSDGVDDVWTADLDGDGRDEVIVGYNGSGGLHVLDPDGVLRWKNAKLGNVWHVAAGDVTGDKKISVLSTSAAGKVHVFSAEGKTPETFSTPFYAHGIRVGRLSKEDVADTILVTSGDALAALNGKGKTLWSHPLSGDINHIDSMAICPTRPWVVCTGRGGRVLVLDCAKEGKPIADTQRRDRTLDATWAIAEDHETPLLLISDRNGLSAFRVEPQAAPGKGSEPEKAKSASSNASH